MKQTFAGAAILAAAQNVNLYHWTGSLRNGVLVPQQHKRSNLLLFHPIL
jgi:hypothetical protein